MVTELCHVMPRKSVASDFLGFPRAGALGMCVIVSLTWVGVISGQEGLSEETCYQVAQ